MRLTSLALAISLLCGNLVRGACEHSVEINPIQAGQSVTISSNTLAVVRAGGTVSVFIPHDTRQADSQAFVKPCGTAYVNANGVATLSGGVVSFLSS